MLSIGRVTTGQIAYYTGHVAHGDGVRAAAYYRQAAEPAGRWAGDGAASLGLSGKVGDGQLEALLAGEHPVTRQPLGRAPRQVLGLDLTFSAPKSASLLAYLLDEGTHRQVRAAHDAAVTAALGWLEDEAAVVRRGHDGAQEHRALGVTGAVFAHATSRDLDPQLHSHVVIAAMAEGPDGRYTQLHARQLYRCAATAGHLYQAALRQQLSARLGVQWEPVVKGQAEITGLPADALAEFSSRSRAIAAERERIVADARADNARRVAAGQPPRPLPHGRALAEQATLASRKAKDHHAAADLTALVPAWRAQARAAGLDVDAPQQLLTALRSAPQPVACSWQQLVAELAGDDGLTADRAWVDRRDVIQAVAARLHQLDPAVVQPGEDAAAAAVRLADDWCAQHGVPLHSPEQSAQPTQRWSLRYTTDTHLQRERHALTVVTGRQAETRTGLGDPDAARKAAADLTLGAEQHAAVSALTARGAGVDLLIAPAGAGKTTLLAAAVTSWQQAGLTVIGASTAAKAVQELAGGAGITDARTIASLLRHLNQGWRIEQHPGEDGHPRNVRTPFTLTPAHVLVVDEAAMTSTRDLHQLITATAAAGAKLVLTGDPRQLPSIKAGGLVETAARHLDAADGDPRTIRLTETRRASEQWEREAQKAWHAGNVEAALAALEQHQRVHYDLTDDTVLEAMVDDWQRHRDALAAEHRAAGADGPAPEPLMVAHRRVQVHALNQAAQARLHGAVDPWRGAPARVDLGGAAGYTDVVMLPGEPVVTTVADRAAGVINGTRGVITAVHPDAAVTVRTGGGQDIALSPQFLHNGGLQHAYALTAHRAQGSTAPAALVLADTTTLTSEWAYSACTRGRRNDLYVLTPATDEQPQQPARDTSPPRPTVQRAALIAAMTRTSDQRTAIGIAHDNGIDLLHTDALAAPDLPAWAPTQDDYRTAARLTAVRAHRAGTLTPSPDEIDEIAATLATAEQPAGTAVAARTLASDQRAADVGLVRELVI